jgi:Putative MetA-pathway of phenol degradation
MFRHTILPAALALAAVGIPAGAFACSQCLCGSPTPPGYLLSDATKKFSYGLEERYLSKENALAEEPGSEAQIEHRASAFVMYRPAPRVALQARLPWIWKKNTEKVTGEEEATTSSNGLGDADVLGRVDVLRFGNLFSRRGVVAAVANATMPTGSNDRKNGLGDRLEAHLQPGTGAWSGTFGLASDLALISSSMSASIMGRVNGESSHGYRYGNVLLFNAGYARTMSASWQAGLELNGRVAEKDRTEEGEDDPNTGGTLLYLAPSVRWGAFGPLALDFLVQIPVAKHLYGDQTEKTTGRIALVWTQ